MMPMYRRLLLAGTLLLVHSACLTNTQTNTLETDVADLRTRFALLQNEHAALREQIAAQTELLQAALASKGDDQRIDRAELFTRLDSMQNEMSVLLEKLEDTNFRLSALSGDIQATRNMYSYGQLPNSRAGGAIPSAETAGGSDAPLPTAEPTTHPPAAALGAGGASPEEIYNTSYADYTKGNYPLAILGFQEYLEKFGASDFADDALYWVGESYFSQGKFSDAINALEQVIQRFPQGDKVPAAHLKKGFAYFESNRTAQGVVQLNSLIENYPNSDEARLARERLLSMGLRDR